MVFVSSNAALQAPSSVPGLGQVAAVAEKAAPGGIFGALLEAVTELLARATGTETATGAAPGQSAPAGPPGLIHLDEAAGQPPASPDATAAGTGAGPAAAEGTTLLGTLGEALAAIEKALADGDKPDKDSLDRLAAALDGLAAALAQPLQPPPAAVLPGADSTATNAPGYRLDAATALALLQGRGGDLPPAISGLGLKGAALAGKGVEVDPDALLNGLSGKLADLAERLGQSAPELSEKLATLGKALGATDPDPALLARLGFVTDAASPQARVAAAIGSNRGSAPPSGFSAPSLTLPPGSALAAERNGAVTASASPPDKPVDKPDSTTPAAGGADSGKDSAPNHEAPRPGPLPPDAQGTTVLAAQPGPPLGPSTPATGQVTAAAFQPAAAAYQPPPGMINLVPFALAFAHQAAVGATNFSIRLDPPELGRVDVKLRVDGSGNFNAHMSVERTDTLDLMQRDRGQLERALAQAGIDTGRTSLEFSLNQNPSSGQGNAGNGNGSHRPFAPPVRLAPAADTPSLGRGPTQVGAIAGALVNGGVNLFV